MHNPKYDVAISGASQTGLALALALKATLGERPLDRHLRPDWRPWRG